MTNPDPVPTHDLARRFESAHVECAAERLAGIGRSGNPHGVHVDRSGRCAALTASLPVQWMNTIHLVGEVDPAWLCDVAGRYRDAGRRPQVEVVPGDLTPTLAGVLDDLGFVQQGFHAAVYAPARQPESSAAVDVRLVSADTFDAFLDTFLAGFGASAAAKGNMRHWVDQPNWHLYLATVNGTAAAAGVLTVQDGVGYLAAAATVPAFRRTGCQSALIRRRTADAHALGCGWVTGQCGYASPSHRNLHRGGLRLAYTKAVWSPR